MADFGPEVTFAGIVIAAARFPEPTLGGIVQHSCMPKSAVQIKRQSAAAALMSNPGGDAELPQRPIPRERLIGGSGAFDTEITYRPAAAALQVALPPIERLFQAAREMHEFAEAIRLGLKLVDTE